MLTTKYKCLHCPVVLKKADKQAHERMTGHEVKAEMVGKYNKKPHIKLLSPKVQYKFTRNSLKKQDGFRFTGKVRKDFKFTMELIDSIKGVKYVK